MHAKSATKSNLTETAAGAQVEINDRSRDTLALTDPIRCPSPCVREILGGDDLEDTPSERINDECCRGLPDKLINDRGEPIEDLTVQFRWTNALEFDGRHPVEITKLGVENYLPFLILLGDIRVQIAKAGDHALEPGLFGRERLLSFGRRSAGV
ncbi:hypothetical protein D9M68_369000 [compost metagenome]